jgi:hypothetical protein
MDDYSPAARPRIAPEVSENGDPGEARHRAR